MQTLKYTALLLLLAGFAACTPNTEDDKSEAFPAASSFEAIALNGDTLRTIPMSEAAQQSRQKALEEALSAYKADSANEEAIVWYGRRLAYMGQYRDAIRVFSEGLRVHPESYRLLRHRGHRYVTLRELDKAIADFELAARLIEGEEPETEPDGQPNAQNIPLTTTQFNIWYHLGLAHYLKGDWAQALAAYERCMSFSTSYDDNLCATTDWMFMTLHHLDRSEDAARLLLPIRDDMQIIENEAYHSRLRMYQGKVSPEELLGQSTDSNDDESRLRLATQGYGMGFWYLVKGDTMKATQTFKSVVSLGNWPAFGHIAAEAALVRLSKAQ